MFKDNDENHEIKKLQSSLKKLEKKIAAITDLRSDIIEYIEPNRKVYICGPGVSEPDDEYFQNQWNLGNINVPDAWEIEAGEKTITVAIVDSGIDYNHVDLADNYMSGGYDFFENDDDPYPNGNGIDDDGDDLIDEGLDHGTHVAGIIGAVTNNATGISGIAQVNIIAERVLDSDGNGTSFDVVDGISHAVEHGAKIINLSLGGGGSQYEEDVCKDAWDRGCIIIGAAGNDYGQEVNYPAAYEQVIAVSAIDSQDAIASFSNIGPEIELAAPGVSILSTITDNRYEQHSGTSMAAPHVSGVTALILSANPGLSNEQVRMFLQDTATDLGIQGYDHYFGFGKINAHQAVMVSSEIFKHQTLTVYNDGGNDLEVTNITTINSWLMVDKTSFILEPGELINVFVIVDSTNLTTGTYNDVIEIFSNDPDENPIQIPVIVQFGDNHAPELMAIEDKIVLEGELLEFTVDAVDPDGDVLIYSAENLPAGSSFAASTRTFSWAPGFDQAGVYTGIRFEVTDGDLSDSEEITISVENVNRPPELEAIGDMAIPEGQLLEFTINATDLDGDELTYSAENLPAGSSFDAATRTFSWTPDFNQAGVYTGVTFTVTDGSLTDSEVITITVENVNRPPELETIGDKAVPEGELLEFTINATDPDGDELTYSAENLPAGSSFDAATRIFSWTPGFDQAGIYTGVVFTVTDGSLTDSEEITITVNKKMKISFRLFPKTINRSKKVFPWVIGIFKINNNNIDKNFNIRLKTFNGEIIAKYQRILKNRKKNTIIIAYFTKADLLSIIPESKFKCGYNNIRYVTVYAYGKLISGEIFHGTDVIRIIE